MNWNLIFLLSIVGAVMGFLTVSVIPSNVEPFFWIAVFVFNAFIITNRAPGKYFGHAWWVSVVSGLWIGLIHAMMHDTYMSNHQDMVEQFRNMPGGDSALAMAISGPIFGMLFGLVSGLVTLLVAKLRKSGTKSATA